MFEHLSMLIVRMIKEHLQKKKKKKKIFREVVYQQVKDEILKRSLTLK